MASNAKASKAVNVLLDIARTEFKEPDGSASNYRFSVSPDGTRLEILHGLRRPFEWAAIDITLKKE